MKIFVNFNFSDFEPLFRLFGGLCAKCPFYNKKVIFTRGIFWDQPWLAQTPPTGFLDFFLIFQIFVFHICFYLGYLGVEGSMCKILELYDQNPWRNNLSKLLTFDPILQWPYSALAARSRPLDGFDYWSLVYKDSNWRGMFLVLWCIIVVSFNSRMLIPTCVSLN